MKNKFIKLINLTDKHKEKNIKLNNYGMILDSKFNNLSIMFFNENNLGQYIIVDTDIKDVEVLDFEIPKNFQKQIEDFIKSHKLNSEEKFDNIHFNDCDWVELTVEDEKYSQYNIHKGYRGVVTNDGVIINNKVLVDFSGVDENGEFYGDIISVNINDLKLVEDKNNNDTFNQYIKEYDLVELLVEHEKYSKYNVHKGNKGCVISKYAINNKVEVDFTHINKDGNFCGDVIVVNIKDLKVIE